jgi:hypothetical protein
MFWKKSWVKTQMERHNLFQMEISWVCWRGTLKNTQEQIFPEYFENKEWLDNIRQISSWFSWHDPVEQISARPWRKCFHSKCQKSF